MTIKDYQQETAQNALDAWKNASSPEEKARAMKLFVQCNNDAEFWTEERMLDYLKYEDQPVGSVCPMFKEE